MNRNVLPMNHVDTAVPAASRFLNVLAASNYSMDGNWVLSLWHFACFNIT
jgi:hypothetical protein